MIYWKATEAQLKFLTRYLEVKYCVFNLRRSSLCGRLSKSRVILQTGAQNTRLVTNHYPQIYLGFLLGYNHHYSVSLEQQLKFNNIGTLVIFFFFFHLLSFHVVETTALTEAN